VFSRYFDYRAVKVNWENNKHRLVAAKSNLRASRDGTRKTCLVPRSDEFQGSRSKVKVISGIFRLNSAVCVRFVFGKTSLACSLKFLKIFFVNILVWFRAVRYRRLFGVP